MQRHMESSANVRKLKIMEMMKFLSVEKIGQIVNVEEMIFAAFINVMSNGLVSRDIFETGGVGEKDVKVRSFVNKIIDKCSPFGLADVFPVLKGLDFWGRRKAMDIYRGIELIWGDVINERRGRRRDVDHDSGQDFLDVLLGTEFADHQILILLTDQ
ncbi:hypothetical protein BUALT_Bualt06G0114400 [Buddleja alternifolia]|uniref:Uncharacterized protein n=1 Tax=Buddleja alternifolia TaxID=168488 RepID=A0AAV6XMV2_9LAMI|nr:hypothetical protein BUALT_Bualt06G0114400 [Buddleja alternifolia]